MRSWVNGISSQRTIPLGYLTISKLLSLARTGVASTVMLSCSIKEKDRGALSHLAFFSYMPMNTPMHVYTERGIYHIQKWHAYNHVYMHAPYTHPETHLDRDQHVFSLASIPINIYTLITYGHHKALEHIYNMQTLTDTTVYPHTCTYQNLHTCVITWLRHKHK